MRETLDRILFLFKGAMLIFLVGRLVLLAKFIALAYLGKQVAGYGWLGSVFVFAAYLWVVMISPNQWLWKILAIAVISEMMKWLWRQELIEAVGSLSSQVLIAFLISLVLGLLGGITARVLVSHYYFDFEDRDKKTRIIRTRPGVLAFFTAEKQLYECFWIFGLTMFIISEWGFYLYKRYWVFESSALLISTAVYVLIRLVGWVVVYRCSVNVYRLSWKYAAQAVLYLDMAYVAGKLAAAAIAARPGVVL